MKLNTFFPLKVWTKSWVRVIHGKIRYIILGAVPPQLQTFFHHQQHKVSTSQASIWGPSWPNLRNLSVLICSPTAFIPTSLTLPLQCLPPKTTSFAPATELQDSADAGPSFCASPHQLGAGFARCPARARGVTSHPLLTGKSLPLSSLDAS